MFSLDPSNRDDFAAILIALEALFIVGIIAAGIGAQRFMVMERPEARVYDTLKLAGLLSFLLVIAVEVLALFSASLRRFALFGLGRLLLYLLGMIGVSLVTPLP